jgi:pentatricopeptide repeat protein
MTNPTTTHSNMPMYRHGRSCLAVQVVAVVMLLSSAATVTTMAFQVTPSGASHTSFQSPPVLVAPTTTTATHMTLVVDTLDLKYPRNDGGSGRASVTTCHKQRSATTATSAQFQRRPPQPRQPTSKTTNTSTTIGTATTSKSFRTGDYWTQLVRLSRRGQVADCQALVQAYQIENADHYDDEANDCMYQSYHHLLDALAAAAATTATATDSPSDNVDHWGHEANQILQLLQTRYPETLDVVMYNKVLKVWSSCARPILTTPAAGSSSSHPTTTVAWLHSHALLQHMVQEGLADVISYTTHLTTLATHGTPAAAQQAQDICQTLYDQYYQATTTLNITTVQPTTRTWNMVLLAWVKCGEPARAEQVLKQMQDMNMDSMQPNVVSYSAILDGWAKHSLTKQARRASFTTTTTTSIDPLERMERLYNKLLERSAAAVAGDDASVRPSHWTYVTLIHAYAKRRDVAYTLKAQDLIFTMHQQARLGRSDLQPNAILVSAVLDAWQKSGASGGAQQAEALLDWMIAASVQDQDPQLAPNEYSFSCKCVGTAKLFRHGHCKCAPSLVCAYEN